MNDTIYQAVTLIIPLVIAIVFHEVSHGYVAKLLGDPTAAEQKRLSLNPLRHVDPIGTIILPGILKLAGGPVFGWAKPVPVIKQRLRNPRVGMMVVAAAGPASNLVMGVIGAVMLGLVVRSQLGLQEPGAVTGFIIANLINFLSINVFLALFNLIPLPPFDGGHIVEGLLPRGLARSYAKLHRHAFLVMIGLLVVLPSLAPSLDIVSWLIVPPVQWLTGNYVSLAALIARG